MFGKLTLLAMAPAFGGADLAKDPAPAPAAAEMRTASLPSQGLRDEGLQEAVAMAKADLVADGIMANAKFSNVQAVYGIYSDGTIHGVSANGKIEPLAQRSDAASTDALKMLALRLNGLSADEKSKMLTALLADDGHDASYGFSVTTGNGKFSGRLVLIDAPAPKIEAAPANVPSNQTGSQPAAPKAAPATPAASTDPNAEILRRLQALEEENARLRQQQGVGQAPVSQPGPGPAEGRLTSRLLQERMEFENQLSRVAGPYNYGKSTEEVIRSLDPVQLRQYTELANSIQLRTSQYLAAVRDEYMVPRLGEEDRRQLETVLRAEEARYKEDTKRIEICNKYALENKKEDNRAGDQGRDDAIRDQDARRDDDIRARREAEDAARKEKERQDRAKDQQRDDIIRIGETIYKNPPWGKKH